MLTFVNSSCFNFYQLFPETLRKKINQYVFSRTTRGKRIQQSCLVFHAVKHYSNYNEPGETDLPAILMTF